jgi:DNA polymerase
MMPDTLITLDFETYYDTKQKYGLKHITTEAYIRDPRFEVIGVAAAAGDEPPRWFGPEQFADWAKNVRWGSVACLAHHAHFDGFILSEKFGAKPAFWYDTLSMARELHGTEVGGSLHALAEHYAVGRKGTEVVNANGLRRADFPPEQLRAYADYCVNDVVLTRQIFRAMRPKLGEASIRGIDMMVRMFTEPSLFIDIPYLEKYLTEERIYKEQLIRAALDLHPDQALTPEVLREVLMSNDRLALALMSLGVSPPTKVSKARSKRAGHEVKTWAFAKSDPRFKELLEFDGDNGPAVRAVVEARLATKSTINETRTERLLAAGAGGRAVPVYLKWYAAHTGRAGGGDRLNFQNLERVDPEDPRKGSLRKSLCAPSGYSVVVVDSAQIEARVLAWLANQHSTLDTFRRGEDLYSTMGTQLFGRPIDKKTTPKERFVSKALTLGLGYGMGWVKCAGELLRGMIGTPPVQFGSYQAEQLHVDVGGFAQLNRADVSKVQATIPLDDLVVHCAVTQHLVSRYRKINGGITRFWRECETTLELLTAGAYSTIGQEGCVTAGDNSLCLPDQSRLYYPDLRREEDGYSYAGRREQRIKIYGGALAENITQGVARAIVFEQALRIQGLIRPAGGKIVLTVHDEVVFVAPKASAPGLFESAMVALQTPPDWCKDLPLAAEGGIGDSYGLAK